MSETYLQKEFKKSDVSRIRNIITKQYDKKTKTSVGYSKKEEEHKEGDVWKEGDRTWTIKDGIKQNITKLDKAKELVRIPISCPVCHNAMKKRLDKKMYRIHGFCFDCTVDFETDLKHAGLYKEYEKKVMTGNIQAFVKDLEDWTLDFVNQKDTYVTEQGDVEDWSNVKEEFKTKLLENLKKYKDQISEHIT